MGTEPVSPARVEAFARDGVVRVRGVFDPAEVERARRGIEQVLRVPGPLALTASRPDDPGLFVEDFRRWGDVPDIADLALRSRVPVVAAALLRTPRVRLYHDRVLVKEGRRAQRAPWHQDQPYHDVDGRGVSAWIPVDPVPLAGSLELLAGSHAGPRLPADLHDRRGPLVPRGLAGRAARRGGRPVRPRHPGVRAAALATRSSSTSSPGTGRRGSLPGAPPGALAALPVRRRPANAPRPWRTSAPFEGLADELPAGAELDHPLFPGGLAALTRRTSGLSAPRASSPARPARRARRRRPWGVRS